MNERDFFREVTRDMVVDLGNMDRQALEKRAAEMDTVRETVRGSRAGKTARRATRRTARRTGWRVAAAAVLLLIVSSVGVGAYAIHHWNAGMRTLLPVRDGNGTKYVKSGLARFPEAEGKTQSVTRSGVTVSVSQTLVDNYFAYVDFSVKGYDIGRGEIPGFGQVHCTLDGQEVSSCSRFYDVDADGDNEQEDQTSSYVQKDGTMEYRMLLYTDGSKGFFLDKTLQVELNDLGIYSDEEDIIRSKQGDWTFSWKLTGDSSSKHQKVHTSVGDTNVTVLEYEISPISIRAVVDIPENEEEGADEKSYAVLSGVKLKDGTLLPCILSGGQENAIGDHQQELIFATDHVIDVEQVESLLFTKGSDDGKNAQNTQKKDAFSEENFYEVPVQ